MNNKNPSFFYFCDQQKMYFLKVFVGTYSSLLSFLAPAPYFFVLQQTLTMTTNLPAVSKARNTIHQTLKSGGKKFTKGCSLLVEKPIEKQYYHYYYNLYCFPLLMCPPSHKNSAKNKNIPIHWSNSSYLT